MLRELRNIWDIFAPEEKRKALTRLLLLTLMGFAEATSVMSIMPFLSVLSRPTVISEIPPLAWAYSHLGFSDTHGFIVALGLTSIALVLSTSAFKIVTQHSLNRFIHLQRHSISSRLLSRYLAQPYEFFLTQNPSALAKNILSEADQLVLNVIQPMSQLVAQGTILLAMVLLVFIYDPVTALYAIAVLGSLYAAIYSAVRKRLVAIGQLRQSANSDRYQTCNEALGGIKDVRISNAADAYEAKFGYSSRQFGRHTATIDTLSQVPMYVVEAVSYAGLIIICLVLLARFGDIARVLPALGLYSFAAYRMLPAAQVVYRGVARLRFASSALGSIRRDLQLPLAPRSGKQPPIIPKREIRLDSVTFAYPTAPDQKILTNLDLAIPVNSSIGIVGRSGAGKSTLMDILLGLLQPQAGTLSIDGVVISEDNAPDWQQCIGYVPQHIFLSDSTIRENIAFGIAPSQIDQASVERAARIAQLHEFVAELPSGYETRIGDRGIRLSGGQRQRIGIARALYRDPPVIIMDEATSALDRETEAEFSESLRSLGGKKTIIAIAHNTETVKNFDQIIRVGLDGRAPSP